MINSVLRPICQKYPTQLDMQNDLQNASSLTLINKVMPMIRLTFNTVCFLIISNALDATS